MSMTYLLDSGYALLTEQADEGSEVDNIQITGFSIGDQVIGAIDREKTEPSGNIVFEGEEADIQYTLVSSTEVIFHCKVTRQEDWMEIGSVMLIANEDVPFLMWSLDYGKITKIRNEERVIGTEFILSVMFNIPGLTTRFNFDNLTRRVAGFKTFADDDAVTRWEWEETTDQLFVENDERTNAPAFLVGVKGNFWGCPRVKDFDDDANFYY